MFAYRFASRAAFRNTHSGRRIVGNDAPQRVPEFRPFIVSTGSQWRRHHDVVSRVSKSDACTNDPDACRTRILAP
jgi:hypothetical protein